MPTVIPEAKTLSKAAHSPKALRLKVAPLIVAFLRRCERANCEAARRAKNVADAKARDLEIKARAAKKAAEAAKKPAKSIRPKFEEAAA